MLAAGQSAVAERAAAQGRLQGTDPETGMPIVGAATAAPIVQESPGGVRVAYRNGIPVGFSTPQRALNQEERLLNKPFQTDVAARRRQIEIETNALPAAQRASIAARLGVENTPSAIADALSAGIQSAGSVAPSPEQGEAIRRRATELAADQSVARMRAAETLRNAIATAPAIAAAQAAPAATQTYSFSQPSPPVGQTTPAQIRAGLAPVTNEISPDGTTYVATGLPVLRTGAQPAVNAAPPTEAEVEEALAEGAEVAPAAEREQVISASERAIQARNNQIATLTRQLADANRRRDAVEIRRLSSAIRALQAVRRGIETGTAADIRPQTAREMRGF
jgi:hypothetical protein